MNVTEAVLSRKTCRAFLSTPVPKALLLEILQKAQRAPSGGNFQPWFVYVVAGATRQAIIDGVKANRKEDQGGEYLVYPPNAKEPYRTRRFELGEMLYQLINVPHDDRETRLKWFARNYTFFDAPLGLFFTIDKSMQQGQWADLGMYMQNIMLLAREAGLHTAAQEAWSHWTPLVKRILQIPDEQMFFCGMAIGYEDTTHPLNQLESPRAPLSEIVRFYDF